jgi:hypothetical protein
MVSSRDAAPSKDPWSRKDRKACHPQVALAAPGFADFLLGLGESCHRSAMVHLTSSESPSEVSSQDAGSDRRGSGRRARARDRLMDRANTPYTPNPALSRVKAVENLLLFIDDDLRETALSMERIERYLVSTLDMLEGDNLERAQVQALATDEDVLDQLDALNENLENLRRRVARLAACL